MRNGHVRSAWRPKGTIRGDTPGSDIRNTPGRIYDRLPTAEGMNNGFRSDQKGQRLEAMERAW